MKGTADENILALEPLSKVAGGDPGMTYQRPQCGGIQVWLRALLLVALVVSLGIRVSAAQASSYTCGDGASNHCYAVVWWQDANSPAAINAAYTTMSVVALRACLLIQM